MTPDAAKRYVVVSVIGTGAVVAVSKFAKGETPDVKTGIGLAAVGVMLAVGSEVIPEIAGGFALLILVSSLFVFGGPAFEAVSRAVT